MSAVCPICEKLKAGVRWYLNDAVCSRCSTLLRENEPELWTRWVEVTKQQAKKLPKPKTRICPQCHTEKTLNHWPAQMCEPCWRSRTPEIAAARAKHRHEYHRSTKGRHKAAIKRAKRRGLSWALSEFEYAAIIAWPCSYCGDNLPQTGVALDRLDNTGGYERGNVVPCCEGCNIARSDNFTYEEFKKHVSTTQRMRGTQFIWRDRPDRWRGKARGGVCRAK